MDISDGKLNDSRNVDLVAFGHVLGLMERVPGHVESVTVLERV
ncbi:hypothetical protein [Ligilactobacillus salivarius]|nr:hypothetical protein [Ligilactobacillus salivarius]MDE1507744.1 hypothetical protein [Ligilactobacillus salivarius]MDE1522146.1 hypothetical protein [Ligilactobacillus salivarius]